MRSLLIALFGVATLAHAGPITVTFNPVTVSGPPGALVKFFGTLTNTTASMIFINGDTATLTFPGATLDDSPFLINAPLSIGAGLTSALFEVLDVTIPGGASPGTRAGVLTVTGGADGNAQDNLGSGTFQANVTSAVPEPTTFALTGLAAAGGLIALRRRRR